MFNTSSEVIEINEQPVNKQRTFCYLYINHFTEEGRGLSQTKKKVCTFLEKIDQTLKPEASGFDQFSTPCESPSWPRV